jgi:hypothetical protein
LLGAVQNAAGARLTQVELKSTGDANEIKVRFAAASVWSRDLDHQSGGKRSMSRH